MATEIDRFWSKVKKTETCWVWTGPLRSGYGRARVGGRTRSTHRVAYEWEVGPIPDGLELDHLCRNRACVRPDHLEAVTRTVNIQRAKAVEVANRQACGNGHPRTSQNVRFSTLADGRRMRICKPCQAARRVIARRIAGSKASGMSVEAWARLSTVERVRVRRWCTDATEEAHGD